MRVTRCWCQAKSIEALHKGSKLHKARASTTRSTRHNTTRELPTIPHTRGQTSLGFTSAAARKGSALFSEPTAVHWANNRAFLMRSSFSITSVTANHGGTDTRQGEARK